MANWRAVLFFSVVITTTAPSFAAEAPRFAMGRGHVASRVGDGDWQVARLGDELPSVCHLRTSPVGAVRIELAAGSISLSAETDLDLDVVSRRVVIERGRTLFHNTDNKESWTLVTGTTTFVCAPGSEAEVSYVETIGVNLLQGSIQARPPQAAAKADLVLKAPLEWLANETGESQSAVPNADNWAAVIRKRTEPQPEQGLGQLISKDPQSNSPVRLEVAQYRVNVVLQAPVALVQIDQSFFNPFSRQEEGTFIFNLPEGASVSRFAMYVTHDQLIEGELIDRTRADQIYTSIVRSRRDPAILEQIGNNLFRMRVFPIFARDTKRILLDYTVPLVADRGRYRFELPLMSDLKPIWDFGVTGVIHPPFAEGSISSPTHPKLPFVRARDGRVTFVDEREDYRPPASLMIDYQASEQREPQVRAYTLNDKDQHFVVTIPASANPPTVDPVKPVDLLVLVDTSVHARDLPKARQAVKMLVNNLRPDDRWQLGCVDVNFLPLTTEWQIPRSRPVREALRQLDQQIPLGQGLLNNSVEQALKTFTGSQEARRRVVVYLGDGDGEASLLNSCWQLGPFAKSHPSQIQFHTVKLGSDKHPGRWARLGTTQTGGRYWNCDGGRALPRELFEWALAGMPRDPQIEAASIDQGPAEDTFVDPIWPRGRELHIAGRRSLRDGLKLTLKIAGQPELFYRLSVPDENRDEDVFVGRQWAQRKLEALLSRPNPQLMEKREIVRLCQEWSLMSPYTAFLVLESERDYERWNISRSTRHRYWSPAGTVNATPLAQRLVRANAALDHSPKTDVEELSAQQRRLVQQSLIAAKEALAAGKPSAAMLFLTPISSLAKTEHAASFGELLVETQKALRRESILSNLQLRQSLVDRRAPGALHALTPVLLGLSQCGVNSEYLERHPHAMKLEQPLPDFDHAEVSLADFIDFIQEAVGIPVLIEKRTLSEEGISTDQIVKLNQLRGVPIRTVLEFALNPLNLRAIPEAHLIRVTTKEKADEKMLTHVYPVADLLRAGPLPLTERLGSIRFDTDRLAGKAIENRLQRPVTVDFKDLPVGFAVESIFDEIGNTPIWVDEKTLSEEGISIEIPVSFVARKMPAEVVLNEILDPLNLTYVIRRGVVAITTRDKADELFETRIYSGAGVIDPNPPASRFFSSPYANFYGGMGSGMGFGGFGGAMGGMGGGMGGMGGAMAGGMGGMGGAMGGMGLAGGPTFGFGGGAAAGANADLRNDAVGILPPQIEEPEEEAETEVTQSPPSSTFASFFNSARSPGLADPVPAIRLLQQSTPGKWEDSDGEGGRVTMHSPTFSLVVRQTVRVHAETKETFEKLRRQQPIRRVTSPAAVNSQLAADPVLGFRQLMRVIQQSTPGKWEDSDGEGGRVSPHTLTDSLVIRQTEEVHEEIDQLFAQLRRARYIAHNLPWMSSFEGIDDMTTVLDRPVLTDLPRNDVDQKARAAIPDKVIKLLSVRREPRAIKQTWRRLSAVDGLQQTLTVHRHAAALELTFADRIMRAAGPYATVAYPGLSLVEMDAWGDAVRQVADATLPWLPHRSNEELARMFDVTSVLDNESEVTLRMAFPHLENTYLEASYLKGTGTLTSWRSVLDGETRYKLQFSPKLVTAVDSAGKELERWELVAEGTATALPGLKEGWDNFLLVESANLDTPLLAARAALRRGDRDAAIRLLQQLQNDRPQHPLVNFLLAWAIGSPGASEGDLARQQREALEIVARAGTNDLLRLITSQTFPSIGAASLHTILLLVPEQQRTGDLWTRLSELSAEQGHHDVALNELERAISATTNGVTRLNREVTRIELLLDNSRPTEADAAARELALRADVPIPTIDLALIFYRSKSLAAGDLLFEKYLRTAQLSNEEKAQAWFRRGIALPLGEVRWKSIATAAVVNPQLESDAFRIIVSEAQRPEDAEYLENVARDLKPGTLQTEILIRQATLTNNPSVAADIWIKLERGKRVSEDRLREFVRILDRDSRSKELIEFLERRLIKKPITDSQLLECLKRAYERAGRWRDVERIGVPVNNPQKWEVDR